MAVTNIKSKKAISVYIVLIIIAFVLMYGRLFWLQVIKGEYYVQKAHKQQTKGRLITPERGTIYDSTGDKKLAQSTSVNILTAVPGDVENKEKVAKELAEFLKEDSNAILEKLNKKVGSVKLASNVNLEESKKILSWINKNQINGLSLDESVKRIYPYNSLASHVLGCTGADDQGLSGLELQYDSVLAGVAGKIIGYRDAKGGETPFKEEQYISPENGKDLVLTIDGTIQQIVEKELKKAVIENVSDNGTAIVMRPATGEVVAMATYPDFNLNEALVPNTPELKDKWPSLSIGEKNNELNSMWRNKCISDAYEPGSCFKLLTASAALEENVVELDTPGKFNCRGSVKFGKWQIKCWRHTRPHGPESLREGIQNSCNPVFIQMSQLMSKDAFCDYLEAFRIGKKTGIDLPGEAQGIVHDKKTITDIDVATTSFGQTISVTPIQLTSAISCIVNGGNYMKPYVVKEIKSADGTYSQKIEPTLIKQVVSDEVSKDMLSAMESTVLYGTAGGAKINGYRVGGKTATAEQGRGTNTWYAAGYVGVAPVNNPELVVYVYLNNPKGPQGHQGGLLCGPVVGNILSESL
ncbi:MAG: penicillin-binding transpeptidase domain-containing protein, partial [Clostridia bacterium]